MFGISKELLALISIFGISAAYLLVQSVRSRSTKVEKPSSEKLDEKTAVLESVPEQEDAEVTESSKTPSQLVVKYKGKTVTLTLRDPPLDKISKGKLLRKACNAVGLKKPGNLLLVHKGKLLKDGSVFVQGVRNKDVCELVVDNSSPAEKAVRAMKSGIEEQILPLVERYVAEAGKLSNEEREDGHRRLSETLLGRLIQLDAIDINGDQKVRQQRKETISWIQSLIIKLDDAFKGVVGK